MILNYFLKYFFIVLLIYNKMAINWSCSISLAIISVLIWMLMCKLFCDGSKPQEDVEIYKSTEAFILYSVFIAYQVNHMIYPNCKI